MPDEQQFLLKIPQGSRQSKCCCKSGGEKVRSRKVEGACKGRCRIVKYQSLQLLGNEVKHNPITGRRRRNCSLVLLLSPVSWIERGNEC